MDRLSKVLGWELSSVDWCCCGVPLVGLAAGIMGFVWLVTVLTRPKLPRR